MTISAQHLFVGLIILGIWVSQQPTLASCLP